MQHMQEDAAVKHENSGLLANTFDGSVPGLVVQQSLVSEELVLPHFRNPVEQRNLTTLVLDSHYALIKDEERLAMLTLADDVLVIEEGRLQERIGHLRPVILRHTVSEDLQFGEELGVDVQLIAQLRLGHLLEPLAIHRPEHRVRSGPYRCIPRGLVEEGELAEGTSRAHLEDSRGVLDDVEVALLDHVEAVCFQRILRDDRLARLRVDLACSLSYVGELLCTQAFHERAQVLVRQHALGDQPLLRSRLLAGSSDRTVLRVRPTADSSALLEVQLGTQTQLLKIVA
mmetsp:Transcript_32194/g.68486  ORF Transcript_32194/g.68486 Transcript_32194/m.68486 type:complete len:286 (+) Transcript_32194:1099-1956(+)